MNKIRLILLVMLLSSCTSMHYGNFTHLSSAKNHNVANNAATQLTHAYLPAQTIFCITQTTHDDFGRQLIKALHKSGYGVLERDCQNEKLQLSYVIDVIQTEELYRVSLYVNHTSLSRIYKEKEGEFTPLSPWSYQESVQ